MTLSLFITIFVVAVVASLFGVFVILRRMALTTDALSHVALPGMALALRAGIDPFIGAFSALFLAVISIFFAEKKLAIATETLIGIMFTSALALGMIIIPSEELIESLFGEITKINNLDSIFALIIGVPVIVLILINFKKFAQISFSQELFQSQEGSSNKTEFMFLLALALSIALGIKIVGSLLMGALIILPAISAKNFTCNFKNMTITSIILGLIISFGGVFIAEYFNFLPGATIILFGGFIFLISLMWKTA